MQLVDDQSIQDLEFDAIKLILHDYCHSGTARLKAVDLHPHSNFKQLKKELGLTKEFHRIKTESFSVPRLEFNELESQLDLLKMPGSMLSIQAVIDVRSASILVNDYLKFLKDNPEEFPLISTLLERVYYTKEIVDSIDVIVDDKGEIKDSASPELEEIRQRISAVRKQISRNFNRILKEYKGKGWLAETNEAFLNDRRVLSVISSYKRQVRGKILGTSKTGGWTYIEPEVNTELTFEFEQLQDDEGLEICRILTELSAKLRKHLELISGYQFCLVELDFLNAKARVAIELDADLPGLTEETTIELIEAYHPLLLLTNKRLGIKTLPQRIEMDKFSRMLVISGPNAGGKSITLKTVGLLQLMFQSALLVPVNPASKMCVFQYILTDIGDNQSIENQLSTYSYRLQRMKHFLDVSNKKTLLLLDEFGTGSDPDLGGALAEVFFEKLYAKKAFGVITTHYANIKNKAALLQNAINGCMLFDQESLEPLFKLSIGQPGSSFTFEVAEINGIDKEILELAKSKLDGRKVNFDSMISELQKEKGKVERINQEFLKAEQKAKASEREFDNKRKKYENKVATQHEMIEKNNQFLGKGKKLNQFIKQFNSGGGNRPLMDEIRKYLAVEKTKLDDATKKTHLKEKTKAKKQKRNQLKNNIESITLGCTVKLTNGREKGTVMELNNGTATVAFGVFKTKVEVSKLEFVK